MFPLRAAFRRRHRARIARGYTVRGTGRSILLPRRGPGVNFFQKARRRTRTALESIGSPTVVEILGLRVRSAHEKKQDRQSRLDQTNLPFHKALLLMSRMFISTRF